MAQERLLVLEAHGATAFDDDLRCANARGLHGAASDEFHAAAGAGSAERRNVYRDRAEVCGADGKGRRRVAGAAAGVGDAAGYVTAGERAGSEDPGAGAEP